MHTNIDKTENELQSLAVEIVDDIEINSDLGDNLSCFIRKDLYEDYKKIDKRLTKLYEKQKREKP
jgi:hypothetical protein